MNTAGSMLGLASKSNPRVERGSSLPSRLSGGQQQRAAIARALVNQPRLLLADEPSGGNLDSATGAEVLDLLLKLQGSTGMTVVLATHDPQVAARCTRLVKLQDGKIVEDVQAQGRLSPPDLSHAGEKPERRSGI